MRIFFRAAGCTALWLFVFACGNGTSHSTTTGASSSSTGSGVDAGGSIIGTHCSTLAAAFCEAEYTCCTNSLGQLGNGTGVAACEQAILSGLGVPYFCSIHSGDRELIEASLQAGTTVFEQAQFDICLAQLKSMLAGGAACTEPPRHVLLTTCTNAFRGQGMPGDACPFTGNLWQGYWEDSARPCKAGRCENGTCVPFLRVGDACLLDQLNIPGAATPLLCNFPNQEACWGVIGAGGAGGGGGMGTCRPQAELGDACDPGNDHECKSLNCDATGKCVLPDPEDSACDNY